MCPFKVVICLFFFPHFNFFFFLSSFPFPSLFILFLLYYSSKLLEGQSLETPSLSEANIVSLASSSFRIFGQFDWPDWVDVTSTHVLERKFIPAPDRCRKCSSKCTV